MDEFMYVILPYLVTLISVIVVFLLAKYLKITVDKEVVQNLLYAIINNITNVEQIYRGQTGLEKQKRVVNEITQGFPDKDKNILKKTFGSLDVAVEKAFQLSHLARKAKPVMKLLQSAVGK